MSMCNRALQKRADTFPCPGAVAIIPNRFIAAFIFATPNAGLVWPARGQRERK